MTVHKTSLTRLFTTLIVSTVILFNVIPFLFLAVGSLLPDLKTDRGIELGSLNPWTWTLESYRQLHAGMLDKFLQYLWNTLVVSSVTTATVLLLSVPGAYGLSRYRFHGRGVLRYSALWGYLFPPVVLVFPYASLLKIPCSLGRSLCSDGGFGGLILANCAFCLPFGIWLMVQYFCAVPQEFDKAGAADGAKWYQILIYILIPRALPGIAAVAMFTFILSWNDVVLSAVLAKPDHRTIAAGVKESIFDTDQRSYSTFAAASLWVAGLAVFVFGFIQVMVDRQMRAEAEVQS